VTTVNTDGVRTEAGRNVLAAFGNLFTTLEALATLGVSRKLFMELRRQDVLEVERQAAELEPAEPRPEAVP